jgi:hypothetical protein
MSLVGRRLTPSDRGWKPLPLRTGRPRSQGGLRRKAHPEPLPSFVQRKVPRTFSRTSARRPSTINATITPRRDAFADLPASGGADLPAVDHPIAPGSRSHSAHNAG